MRFAFVIAAAVFASAHLWNAQAEAPTRATAVTIALRATSYNAGRVGQAFLLPDERGTQIVVRFSGVPPHVGRPVHVYTYVYDGSCAALPAQPRWSLNDRVLAQSVSSGAPAMGINGPFTIANRLPVPLPELRRGRYALVLRTAPADGDVPIFCGDIGTG